MKSISIYRWGALLVALVAVYLLTIVRYYLPIVEGWWNIYPWAVDHGRALYKDLFLVFPPLHYLFVRAVWVSFGDSFLAMRLAGIAAHLIEVVFVYLFLCRLYSPLSAFWGALLSALWLLSGNGAYVSGDYHPTVGFFVAASLLASTYFRDRAGQASASRSAVVAFIIGACCGCLLLTKQNVGVFYTLAVPVFIVLVCSNRARLFAADNLTSLISIAVAFGVGALLPLAAVTALIGSDWIVSYASSDAKGSAATFLTRFMTDADTRRQLIAAMAIAAIWVVRASDVSLLTWPALSSLKPYYERGEAFYRRAESLYRERVPAWAPPVRPILVRLALIVLVLLWARWRHVSAPLIVPLAGILIISVRSWRSEIDMGWWHRFSPALMGGLVYAGTMTAGLNQVSLEPLAAVTFAAICQFLSERVPFSGFRWSALAVAVMLVSVWMKASGPLYSWWGYLQGNIFSARFEVPFKQLSGFKVDAQTRDLFDTLSEYKSRLRGSDTIFAYPSIPIAYMLLDRPPPMRFPILWFDVTSERNAPEIIADLDKANPNYIFWLLPYRAVYEGHALLRRQTSLAFFIDRWIFAKIASGDYVLEKNEPLGAPVVQRPYDFGDRSVAEIFTAKDIKCGPYVWRTGGEQLCEEGSVLPAGKFATFVFRTRYDFIEAVRRDRIGIVTDHDFDQYQFLVLRRSDR